MIGYAYSNTPYLKQQPPFIKRSEERGNVQFFFENRSIPVSTVSKLLSELQSFS